MGQKREHHVIPRLYLKGFAESEAKPFIWVYTKGRPFKPGGGTLIKYNPARIPIRKAAAIPYAYSFTNSAGVFDADTYENELERLEKPSDPIIRKIRNREMISQEE